MDNMTATMTDVPRLSRRYATSQHAYSTRVGTIVFGSKPHSVTSHPLWYQDGLMAGINFFACNMNIGLYSPMWCSSVTAGLPVLKHSAFICSSLSSVAFSCLDCTFNYRFRGISVLDGGSTVCKIKCAGCMAETPAPDAWPALGKNCSSTCLHRGFNQAA